MSESEFGFLCIGMIAGLTLSVVLYFWINGGD